MRGRQAQIRARLWYEVTALGEFGAEAAGSAAQVRELRLLRAERDVVDFFLEHEERARLAPAECG